MTDHSISAFYAGGPGGTYYQAVLECSCGFSSNRNSRWEYAGVEMDEHLKAVQEVEDDE